MSTRWQPVRGRTVADNRCATDVNIKATDGHSALQGAHVVRPLTVAKYPPLDTTRRSIKSNPPPLTTRDHGRTYCASGKGRATGNYGTAAMARQVRALNGMTYSE